MPTTVRPPTRAEMTQIDPRTGKLVLTRPWQQFFDKLELVIGDKIDDVSALWPVGSVFFSAVATNPATLLGFGTWVRVAEGEFIVGQKTGDANFATPGDVAGTLAHIHSVNPPAIDPAVDMGGADAYDTYGSATGTLNVALRTHRHTLDIPAFNSASAAHMPPGFVLYVWERTA